MVDDVRKAYASLNKAPLLDVAWALRNQVKDLEEQGRKTVKYSEIITETKDQLRQLKELVRAFCVMRYPALVGEQRSSGSYWHPDPVGDVKESEPPSREEVLTQEVRDLQSKLENETYRFVEDLWVKLKDH